MLPRELRVGARRGVMEPRLVRFEGLPALKLRVVRGRTVRERLGEGVLRGREMRAGLGALDWRDGALRTRDGLGRLVRAGLGRLMRAGLGRLTRLGVERAEERPPMGRPTRP